MLEKLFLAVGLVPAFEGALYALFPSFLRSMVKQSTRSVIPPSAMAGWLHWA